MSQVSTKQVALITGANRGIGLELAKQCLERGYSVIACCRTPSKADDLNSLKSNNKDTLTVEKLDITNDEQITTIAKKYKNKPIDLLILNAGTNGQKNPYEKLTPTRDLVSYVVNTNSISNLLVIQALYNNVKSSNRKQIMVVSSAMGCIELMSFYSKMPCIPYRISKACLNMGVKCVAKTSEANKDGVRINPICPGWVKTEMGGKNAMLTPKESVDLIFKNIINNYKNLKNGQFYDRKGNELPN